jgi:competence protein ComEC
VTDVRLACPAALAWFGAFWATGSPSPVVRVAAVASALCTLLLGAALLLSRAATSPSRGTLPVRGCALACAALTSVLTITAVRGAERENSATVRWAADRAVVSVTGRATADSVRIGSGLPSARPGHLLRVTTIRIGARGQQSQENMPLLVIGDRSWEAVRAGQTVHFLARLFPTARGDAAVAVARAVAAPTALPPTGIWRATERIRSGLREACRDLPEEPGGLLPSLVIGDTSGVPDRLVQDLRTSGLSHLTAVSGTNVTIVLASVLGTLTALGAGRRTRILASGAALAGFVFLARPEPSVLRASTMGAIGLLGLLAGHRGSGPPLLAAATVLLLCQDPWSSRHPGLALSVAATAGLLLISPGWTARLADPGESGLPTPGLPRPLAAAIALPAAACTTCAPVLLLFDLPTNPVSVPANLLAAPAIVPATVLGALAACACVPCPALAAHLAHLGSWATGWIAVVAHRAAAVPLPSAPWPTGPAGAAPLAALALLAALTAEPRPVLASPDPVRARGRRARPVRARIVVMALAALSVGYLCPLPSPLPGAQGRWPGTSWAAVLCDVGQGDALVIRTGPDRAMLIDAGPDPGAIDSCLRRLGIRHLDLVIITHLHADHLAGLPGALRNRDVLHVLTGPDGRPAAAARDLALWVRDSGADLSVATAGSSGTFGRPNVLPRDDPPEKNGPTRENPPRKQDDPPGGTDLPAEGRTVRWWILGPPDAAALPDAGPLPDAAASPGGVTLSGDDPHRRPGATAPAVDPSVDDPDDSSVNDASLPVLLHLTGPTGTMTLLELADLELAGQRALLSRCSVACGPFHGGLGEVDVVKVAHHGSSRQVPGLYRLLRARFALVSVGEDNPHGHPSSAALTMLEREGATVLTTSHSRDLAVRPGPRNQIEILPRGP